MSHHTQLGNTPFGRSRALYTMIKLGKIKLGGNMPGKIYGKLNCRSGKRMTTQNRIFFKNKHEAVAAGYRPCANCMPQEYKLWKAK